MEKITNPNLLEPLLPANGHRALEDLAIRLVSEAARLAGKLNVDAISCVGDLVRSTNCYYSNLIEGHNTHPVEIERALRGDYAHDLKKRNLQLEALAHIEVQRSIDESNPTPNQIFTKDYVCSLHRDFYRNLPEALHEVTAPITGSSVTIVGGEFRTGEVVVGGHLAPVATELDAFLKLFCERYNPEHLSALTRIISVAASHHRLLWIHPFFDGNGRVTRLFSHALFRSLGIGNALWSVSRGLARNVTTYKEKLASADGWREHDTDGRGSLSLRRLTEFCEFFLSVCIDQVEFMNSLLEPSTLLERIRQYCGSQPPTVLPRGSFELLREIILSGPVPRGRVSVITGYQERQARSITRALINHDVIKSPTPRAPLRLHIPHHVVETWFPRLYPPNI